MKTLISVNKAVVNMLRDEQGAVLVEYALSMMIYSVVGFEGFVNVALAAAGLYQSDTLNMASSVTNRFLNNPLP